MIKKEYSIIIRDTCNIVIKTTKINLSIKVLYIYMYIYIVLLFIIFSLKRKIIPVLFYLFYYLINK